MIRKSVVHLMVCVLGAIIVMPLASLAQPEFPSEEATPVVLSTSETMAGEEETTPTEETETIVIGSVQRIVTGERVVAGKEMEEEAVPFKLFKNQEDIERMLGNKPRFVYDPKDMPDPMIVPWVRRDVLVSEILDVARKETSQGRLQAAKDLLNRALAEYPDSRHINLVQAELKKVAKMELEGVTTQGQRAVVVLPSWIADHTNGILWSEEKPLALIGDLLLSVGDEVPKYAGVTVHEIKKEEVIYSYRDKLFPVAVQGDR